METRPSLLNEQFITDFAAEIEDGLPTKYVCDLFEIPFVTYMNWMKQGEADALVCKKSLECKFFNSIKKAYAKFVRTTKRRIYNGEPGWQGSAWWLERTNKDFVLNVDNNVTQETVIVNPSMKVKNK